MKIVIMNYNSPDKEKEDETENNPNGPDVK